MPEAMVARLRAAGCVFAEDEARLLCAAATGGALEALIERRVAGEPLEHVLGWAEFCGLRVAVGPGVFVPRRRTGHLARLAADLLRVASQSRRIGPPCVVVDLCCGAGAIAMSLLAADVAGPPLELYAADLDPVAVGYARRNLGRAATVSVGDLFDALPVRLRGRVDVLTVNTPYVPTDAIASMPPEAREHEPRLALDGGADGLDLQRRIAASAGDWLAPGGHVLVEASQEQAPASAQLFRAAGLEPRIDVNDQVGATVVLARRVPMLAS